MAMKDEYRSYDVITGKHGNEYEEWAPHGSQSEKSNEWWYMTTILRDENNNLIFQHIAPIHFSGSAHLKAAGLDPNAGLGHYVGVLSLSDYSRNLRHDQNVIVKMENAYDEPRNALVLKSEDIDLDWSFQDNEMLLKLKSKTQEFDFKMISESGTVWSKDSIFNIEGLIAEATKDDPSFYYFIPTLRITGTLSYPDADGNTVSTKVTGEGWFERQWGDYTASAWEWAAMRFFNGDRVNLYAFPQTQHKIGCYRKHNGEVSYFNDFSVRQTEYFEGKNGVWLANAWKYQLPLLDQEYDVSILSKKDVCYGVARTLVESLGEIRDKKGELVGYCTNESMDLRDTNTGPYKNIF